jgi:excinuclease ABC subunit C
MTESSDSHQPFDAKSFLKSVTSKAGVYQMYDDASQLLYIGKAKNLKSRLASYFRKQAQPTKTRSLVQKIDHIEVTVTSTEIEALLLEQNLIKQNRPPYNILLRDDKSYPYIFLSDHDFPRISLHRGAKRKKGRYFGPYPNAGAVRESLSLLQKIFKVRQCEDSFYSNRSRPCLQYQINRCSAPCTQQVSKAEYSEAMRHALMFLEGKSTALITELAANMDLASSAMAFEEAAAYRDQIQHLQKIQAKQYIEGEQGDLDLVACQLQAGFVCIQLIFVRGGRVLGSKSYFPKLQLAEDESEVLAAFISQFYLTSGSGREIPKEIITSHPVSEQAVITAALYQQAGRKVLINHKVRSNRLKWLQLASTTAHQNLANMLANKQTIFQRLESLQDVLALPERPARLECFDISHSSGEATVASCVVFDSNGPLKSDYRRFNIEGVTAGDDFAAMKQALQRRYTRIKSGDGVLPDLLVIDGGKGQLSQAIAVLEELQIPDMLVIGVAKGRTRKAGFEQLIRSDTGEVFTLASDSAALHLLQHIRDESHRFAITGHKQRRDKKRRESPLESIPGVGPKKRKELLRYFGGWQEVSAASEEDLARVPGISRKIAADIYTRLHND